MAHITEMGPFYAQKLYWHADGAPLLHLDTTHEIEPPYRTGKCLVVRMPFSRTAHVVGVWTGARGEKDALLAAVGGRVTSDNHAPDYYDEWNF